MAGKRTVHVRDGIGSWEHRGPASWRIRATSVPDTLSRCIQVIYCRYGAFPARLAVESRTINVGGMRYMAGFWLLTVDNIFRKE
jgi:hypothetical protein